ncbi:MAG: hypothetical protein J0I98_06515 [Mesorhizobium sp.]|nr:hypothetical protein [Mesorhizobium sp.]MBN9242429.1 hypothetical protein [Mesorhizobium sp.]
MRRSRRQAPDRVRQGIGKKLAAAFRYDLKRKGHDEWIAKLAAEFPDEFPPGTVPVRPAEAKTEAWHAFYLRAWQALRFDRQYFAFGGQTPISFMALDGYARRYGIEGEAFERFLAFMNQIDDEWLEYAAQDSKAADA